MYCVDAIRLIQLASFTAVGKIACGRRPSPPALLIVTQMSAMARATMRPQMARERVI